MKSTLKGEYRALDPLVQVEVKCLISMIDFEPADGSFLYLGRPITQVEIVGVVVRRDSKENRLLVHVDDGTGVVAVLIWAKRFEREPMLPRDMLVVGETVVVNGSITWYRGRIQIQARVVNPVGSAGVIFEMVHWNAVINEEHSLVNDIIAIPPNYLREIDMLFPKPVVGAASSGTQVAGYIFSLLAAQAEGSVCFSDIRAKLSGCPATLIDNACDILCNQGSAFRSPEALIEIRCDGNLAQFVLQVLRKHKVITFAQLRSAVQQEERFSRVDSDVVQVAIRYLETIEDNVYVDDTLVKLIY